MKNNLEKVLSVSHWSENLFSFKTTRSKDFRFKSGEFVMIGLIDYKGKPILRAYSICSPSWAEELEFFSIIVNDGELTSKLKKIKVGDSLIVMKKPTGTLILDSLKKGKRLFMISTGTGFAPFASLIREPETYEKFNQIFVTHTVRFEKDLKYSNSIVSMIKNEKLFENIINNKLNLYQTTTRDNYKFKGRITNLIKNKKFFNDLKIEVFDKMNDRIMICGSLEFNNELKAFLQENNFIEGSINKPGDFVVEKAFVG